MAADSGGRVTEGISNTYDEKVESHGMGKAKNNDKG